MKKWFVFVSIVCMLPLVVSAGTIKYVGSSTVGQYIADASKVFATSKFELNTIPESSGGEQCAARNGCSLGGVAREVEQKFLEMGVTATLIGKDAISVIVHKDNPVKGLSQSQLKAIFTGKLKNWREVGGSDLSIKAIIVKKGSATRKVFRKVILGEDEYQGVEVVTPDAMIVSTVAMEKGTIGQISMAFIKGKNTIKPLFVDDQEPNVNNPDYPITRPLYFVTNGSPRGEVKIFIDWTLSPAGQAVIKNRFIGIN
jgi:phosphate transport system substrate-binding protein